MGDTGDTPPGGAALADARARHDGRLDGEARGDEAGEDAMKECCL